MDPNTDREELTEDEDDVADKVVTTFMNSPYLLGTKRGSGNVPWSS